jgi:hypothetical protein
MKIAFILALSMMCLEVSGQARLGSSVIDIKKEFSDKSHELKSGYDSDKNYYIRVFTDIATVFYFFDEDSYCDQVLIIPDDNGKLNYFVEDYNKSYVIINNQEWKMYNETGIASIKLVFPDVKGEKPYFVWTPND